MTDVRAVRAWVPVLRELANSLKVSELETWLLPLDPELSHDAFRLLAPFSVFSAHVEKTYGARICAAAGREVLFAARHRPCATDYDGGWRGAFLAEIKAPLSKERYTIRLLPKEGDCVVPSGCEEGKLLDGRGETLDAIIEAVAKVFGVTPGELKAEGKGRRIVEPRHVAVYLGKKRARASYPELGRVFGDRHHTSMIRSFRSAKAMLDEDPVLRGKMILVERKLGLRG